MRRVPCPNHCPPIRLSQHPRAGLDSPSLALVEAPVGPAHRCGMPMWTVLMLWLRRNESRRPRFANAAQAAFDLIGAATSGN